MDTKLREKQIGKTSLVGIIANTLLGVVKVIIGAITGSVAIITDAVNNLTDTSSSIITIIGTHLAGRRPDMKHPFGFGRVEYLTSLVIGLIVFVTGIEMTRTSVEQIIHPKAVHITMIAIIILVITIVVKIFLGQYTLKRGQVLDSDALKASGLDARSDAVVTFATLISACLNYWKGITIDAWVGAIISLYIIYTGFTILRDTISKMVGESVPRDIAHKIHTMVMGDPMVHGAYDLILNNYGPNRYIGSVNVTVDHDLSAEEVSRNLHKLQSRIAQELHVFIVFGIYAIDRSAPETARIADEMEKFVASHQHVLSYHALYIDEQYHEVSCDLVVDYSSDHEKIRQDLTALFARLLPGYTPVISLDTPFSQPD